MGKVDDLAKKPFLSDEAYVKRLPKHVELGTKSLMAAATAKGFRGKVVYWAEYSDNHRTTLCHFLAKGKWDESVLQNQLKRESIRHMIQVSKDRKAPLL